MLFHFCLALRIIFRFSRFHRAGRPQNGGVFSFFKKDVFTSQRACSVKTRKHPLRRLERRDIVFSFPNLSLGRRGEIDFFDTLLFTSSLYDSRHFFFSHFFEKFFSRKVKGPVGIENRRTSRRLAAPLVPTLPGHPCFIYLSFHLISSN